MSNEDVIDAITRLVLEGHISLHENRPTPITKEQLKHIFGGADIGYLAQVADELNVDLAKYGLDNWLRKAHFFAQIRQETGPALSPERESLNYRPAALSLFGYYQNHPNEKQIDGHVDGAPPQGHAANQHAIANKAYANRLGNGDVASGDGWNYRGGGAIQITGRTTYTNINNKYSEIYGGAADLIHNPDLIAQFPYTVRSAVCYWLLNNLETLADCGGSDADVDRITAVINLKTDSYELRRRYFGVAYEVFV
jgi:putative chitinase